MGLSPPMTLICTSPTATKSRTMPFFPSSMALAHSDAIWLPRSRAWTGSMFSSGRQMTLYRTFPARSQLTPMVL